MSFLPLQLLIFLWVYYTQEPLQYVGCFHHDWVWLWCHIFIVIMVIFWFQPHLHQKFSYKLINFGTCWQQQHRAEKVAVVLIYLLHSEVRPSCLQATLASLKSQESSHTVPHCPRKHTSTRPSKSLLPPTSRISVSLQAAEKVSQNYEDIHMEVVSCKQWSHYRSHHWSEGGNVNYIHPLCREVTLVSIYPLHTILSWVKIVR